MQEVAELSWISIYSPPKKKTGDSSVHVTVTQQPDGQCCPRKFVGIGTVPRISPCFVNQSTNQLKKKKKTTLVVANELRWF